MSCIMSCCVASHDAAGDSRHARFLNLCPHVDVGVESIFLLPTQVTIQDTRIRLSATKKPEISSANKNKKKADLKAKFELREAGTWFILDAAFGLRVMSVGEGRRGMNGGGNE